MIKEELRETNKIIGVYHKDCLDGTASAAVLLKKYQHCKLFPFSYSYTNKDFQKILNKIDNNSIVFILDFSLREEDLKSILENAGEVINIDHHISVRESLENFEKQYPNYEYINSDGKSGASLTWEYLFGEPVPQLIKYVEDKDIWKWEFGEDTKYVDAYLVMLTDKPEELKELINTDIEKIKEKGKIISDFIDYLINRFIENVNPTYLKIDNYIVKGFNAGLFQSELGNILSQKYNEPVALFSINGDFVKLSFRSNSGQNPSALQLASLLGGGGHLNAAGVIVSINEFLRMIVGGIKK